MKLKDSLDVRWRTDILPSTAKVLVVSLVAEFVLLRILNRISDRFPSWMKGEIASDMVFIGSVAYNFAYFASIFIMIIVARNLWTKERVTSCLMIVWVPALLLAQILWPSFPSAVLVTGFLAVAIFLVLVARGVANYEPTPFDDTSRTIRWLLGSKFAFVSFLVLALGTYLAALYLHLGDALNNFGWGPPNRAEVYGGGEILALTAAYMTIFAFWRKPDLRNLSISTAAVALLLIPFLLRPDILSLVAFWSLGFQLLPFYPLYLAAVWSYVFALVNVASRGLEENYLLHGLLLIALVGRMLSDFYSIQLAIVGLLFVSLSQDLSRKPFRSERGDARETTKPPRREGRHNRTFEH